METFPVNIEIDPGAGFCTGVRAAVNMAETLLTTHERVVCLGNLVHNEKEIARLQSLGLGTTDSILPESSKPTTAVMIRAHGEPPATFENARQLRISLKDATCPIVRKLQLKVKQVAENMDGKAGRIILFGKPGHPEIVGLLEYANSRAEVIQSAEQVPDAWLKEPLQVFAQTTANDVAFHHFCLSLKQRAKRLSADKNLIVVHQTICRQMKNREPAVREFAKTHDVMIFVSGSHSSNGRFLSSVAKQANSRTHVIADAIELDEKWFANASSVGISGATSTPDWLLSRIAEAIKQIIHRR
ncbi:4-hydroxy-3-methylbut-2-enyl diphosphate reductase [Lentimicrobium sp.]